VATSLDKFDHQRAELRREHEVVAMLRPEEIALAEQREQLNTIYLGAGRVEAMNFTGAYERLRVRMLEADKAMLSADADEENLAVLDVTRTQHEQRQLPLTVGQNVAVGVRRIHVLPTPLSSYTVYATSADAAELLKQHSLLVDLAARMKTRIITHVDARLGDMSPAKVQQPLAGVAVIVAGAHVVSQLQWLLQRGACEVLILPEHYMPVTRVLIHWTGEEVRRATLAVAASVLRHVPAEATYLNILPEAENEVSKPDGMRELLDARSEAQAVHGLEMRTELHYGETVSLLQRELSQQNSHMLILGLTDQLDVKRRFEDLLQQASGCPMLLVFRSDEVSSYRKSN
jgi:hypothetical protein